MTSRTTTLSVPDVRAPVARPFAQSSARNTVLGVRILLPENTGSAGGALVVRTNPGSGATLRTRSRDGAIVRIEPSEGANFTWWIVPAR